MNTSTDTSVVIPLQVEKKSGVRWQPSIGPVALELVQHKLPQVAQGRILESSVSILSKSVPPTEVKGSSTGLVVGYVQSGKTLSFTTVMALARDNGFKLVIAVTGTSKPLLNQSTKRIKEDLRTDNFEGSLQWNLYTNPKNGEENIRNIQQTIDRSNSDNLRKNNAPTVLITVMKQHVHLKNLVRLLQNLKLQGTPVLVIDDEADQASLNNLTRENDQSSTYRHLLELRAALPNHTFLQYTATPQAPLLINIIDALSPEFVEVLEPGPDYVGGRELFHDRSDLIDVIPSEELPTDGCTEPPQSLLEAILVFIIGVASGLIEGRTKKNANRSMLVHPARETGHHKQYYQWICNITAQWQSVLKLEGTDPDKIDLLKEFKSAYNKTLKAVPNLLPFERLSLELSNALSQTRIKEMNGRRGSTPIIDWEQIYGWILVGGQVMDRGFTVEGLTVTYMPRTPGVGNADTVQQRGRFFGYKRSYLGFCRLYIEQATLSLFQEYVEHEESMRKELQKIQMRGDSLSKWKRVLVLSPEMQPCRHTVLKDMYTRGNYADSWFEPSYGFISSDVIQANQMTRDRFISQFSFSSDTKEEYNRELAQKHQIARNVQLANVIEFLLDFHIESANEKMNQTGVLLQLKTALEADPTETCTIYRISPDYNRRRTVSKNRTITLFQGRTSAAVGYCGDGEFYTPNQVTVQFHSIDLIDQTGILIAEQVPFVAVRVPKRMGLHWIMSIHG